MAARLTSNVRLSPATTAATAVAAAGSCVSSILQLDFYTADVVLGINGWRSHNPISALVDRWDYGYTGNDDLSWDNATGVVTVNTDGWYALTILGSVAIKTLSTGRRGFAMFAQRADTGDNAFACIDDLSASYPNADATGAYTQIMLFHPMCAPYPMPAGSTWFFGINDNTDGGSLADVSLEVLFTKVACGPIPIGPVNPSC